MSRKKPTPKSFESISNAISRSLENKHFASEAELHEHLTGLMRGGRIPEISPQSPLDVAQELMYESWDDPDRKSRIRTARKAISICPDCADAYITLAEDHARSLPKMLELYRQAVEAGARALGESVFLNDAGHFWGINRTRPYMRARAALAQTLWESGKSEESIGHYREMLRLNPNDNQGIRYVLAACLGELGRWGELEELIDRTGSRNDLGPNFVYLRLLLRFVREGDSPAARTEFKTAWAVNPHVCGYVTGVKAIPDTLPDEFVVGSEDEGVCCAADLMPAWEKVPGAVQWLGGLVPPDLQVPQGVMPDSIRPNAPCPCGSGKKFKKCCGR